MWPVLQRSLTGLRGRALNHVLISGQSKATGGWASLLSTVPVGQHWMFAGQRYDGGLGNFVGDTLQDGMQSLVERSNGIDVLEKAGETLAYGFAAYVSANVPGHGLLMSNWAKGGADYTQLAKGTAVYARGTAQVRAARQRLGVNHRVRAVVVAHGENDWNNASYDVNIRQWQLDCETDYFGMTGQTGRLPMLHSQMCSWTSVNSSNSATATSPLKLLAEHKANPTKTVCVCPQYMLPHFTDGVHLVAEGYRWLAQLMAKGYVQHVLGGTQFQPLRPLTVVRTGNVIRVTFTGNVGQLVLDTTLVKAAANQGFEYTNDTAPPAITGVALVGLNAVDVSLASTPGGANEKLRYGYTGTVGASGGPLTGPRGNLRDSDPARGVWGEFLYNWCVVFEEVVA